MELWGIMVCFISWNWKNSARWPSWHFAHCVFEVIYFRRCVHEKCVLSHFFGCWLSRIPHHTGNPTPPHPTSPQPHPAIILRSAATIHSPLLTVLTLIALCLDQTAEQCFLGFPAYLLWHLTVTESSFISHTSDRYLVWSDKSQI